MGQGFRIYLFLGTLLLIFLPAWGELPKRPFVWADDENFKPLIYRNSRGKAAGIFYEVLTEAFKRMNIPLENRLYPWSRTQKLVQEGEADGMVTIYTKSRQRFLKATDPVMVVEERVFVSKENPHYQAILTIDSVEGLRDYTVVETTDAGWSKEHLKGMRIIWVPTAESALNMVALGRADVYLMSNVTGPNFVRDQIQKGGPLRDKLANIVMGKHPFTTMAYRLLIRKTSPYVTIIDRFNAVLQQIHNDGTYEKILQRYQSDMAL